MDQPNNNHNGEEKKAMNGSSKPEVSANGKCPTEEKVVSNGNGVVVGNGAVAAGGAEGISAEDGTLLPHLESIERLMKLPVVEATWNRSQDVYGKVKGSNAMFCWAFDTAENVVRGAVNITAPLVQKLDKPIQLADQTLVKGIDKLEVKAPIIKEQPQEIYNQAKSKVIGRVQPHINKVCSFRIAGQQKAASLKELSWTKANEVLATQYGTMAVSGVDQTAILAERLLDYYFPKSDCDKEEEDEEPVSSIRDPVLHTVQTVGRLSNKIARRVYTRVSKQVKQLKKDDVQAYVVSLIAVLRLTQYLNFINEKMTAIKGNEPSTSKDVVVVASK